jgi:hypothetical protein
MAQQTSDLHVNPSDETIRVGLLTVRFLLTADNSSGSIAAFDPTHVEVSSSRVVPGCALCHRRKHSQ